MDITTNAVVTIHYTLKDGDGNLLDSSEGQDPLAYLHGVGGLIPGLEKELEGKAAGAKLSTVIEPKDAYGTRDDKLIHEVPKTGFEGDEELKVGMQVQLETEGGPTIAIVSEIDGDNVKLDLNHPLADVTLHFDVEVTDVRTATAEELEHGHVHGPGGHQH